ncbi:cytochrome c [Litoreibacter ponti]|uniref:Cytochrome c n=1 Tax=Litoreibacter ponti TaxID=1510457 RepID=A0A2T6BEX0_9RHOB|nr:c-type cytochrome [Litoreibacter ponti]PTX54608.1 cytochrome c [Litoreibacter ponti]
MRALLAACVLAMPGMAPAGDFFTLKGHGGPIMDIAVSPTGQIATASFDNSVGVWDGKTPRWLEGHRAAVNAVRFMGGFAVSAGDDFALELWDLATGDETRLEGHRGKVMALDVAPDGTIASASWDGTVGLWKDGAPRFLEGHAQGVNDVVFRADGQTLYSASADGTIRIWDVAEGAETQLLLRHGFGVNEMILTESWLAYGAVDGVTRVIDPVTGDKIADFSLDRRPILAMAVSPDESRIAVGDGEGFIMVIDTTTWKIERDFRATARGPVWALAFSPDGENIHAGGLDDVMYSWPIETMDQHGQMTTGARTFLEDPATLPNGERQFKRKCSVCHTLTPSSARRAGPTLYNLFGRRAGTVEDYRYSPILTGSDIIWDEDSIDALFDEGPDHYIPGSNMPMQRIVKRTDRDDLVAYLKKATKPEGGN